MVARREPKRTMTSGDMRIGAELALPQALAQNHLGISASGIAP